MAISFSKPDPSSPAAVGSAQFNVTRRGYDQGEVRDFLRMVSAELARLQEREKFLESEMRAMQTRGLSDPGVLDEATVTTLLGEETARVLSVAREAAQQMRDRAAETAERMVRE
ncbi:MAG: DivIVA domain-containing protein, partial [Acidimicrobiaceae bacterium]